MLGRAIQGAGAISGAPQTHARSVVWQFFKHPLEVTVFIVFVSVIGLACITTALTGVLNRRSFSQKLEDEMSRARRIHMPLSAIVLDLDGLHKLNERVGFQ